MSNESKSFCKEMKIISDEGWDDVAKDITNQCFCKHDAGTISETYPVWENSFSFQAGNAPIGVKTTTSCKLCGGAAESKFEPLKE